jgi:FkbM family methyltransferase
MGVFMEKCQLSNGLIIYSNARTPLHELYKEIYRTQSYAHSAIPAIKANDVVIDIGANIGMFSLFAAKVFSTVKVYAFEPAAESFALLKKNVLLNNLTNIKCYQCSVFSVTGEQTLYIDIGSTADTMIQSRIKAPDSVKKERVPCLSLDDLFSKYEIARCNFLKVDVEGSEFDIFLSASAQTLNKIDTIAMEFHEYEGQRGQELAALLKSNGFHTNISRERTPDCGMIYATRMQQSTAASNS